MVLFWSASLDSKRTCSFQSRGRILACIKCLLFLILWFPFHRVVRPAIPICKGGIRLREVRQLVEVPSQPLLPGFELRLPDFQTTKKSHSCYSSCGLWASSIHTAREPAKMLRISPHLTSVQNVHKTPSWMIQKHKCGRGSGLHHTATADSGLGGRCGLNLQETPGPNLQHSPGA